MKNIAIIASAVVVLAFVLTSCSSGGGLGAEQSAGPFKVSLSTSPNPPVAGATELIVKVTKDGAPVQDAAVQLTSSMPGMNMPGPTLTLQPSGDSYSGTINLMAGDWKVDVSVSEASESGSASFSFDVK